MEFCIRFGWEEYDLLMPGEGRCTQDNYYFVPVSDEKLPEEVFQRHEKRLKKKCDMLQIVGKDIRFRAILDNFQLFCNVKVQTGGYGISWGERLDVPDKIVFKK